MMTLPTVTDDTIVEAKDREGVVLVKLTAAWCGPCKMYNPVLEQLVARTGTAVYNMDIDENPDTPRAMQIMSVPTLLVYKDGELRDKLVGAKPYARLVKDLEPWLPQNSASSAEAR